ncbi:5-oxoprolinase subunit PxpB [Bacillus timonensis]|nr:5-oxoprolinase subunit PxpB [Bacillus timonensis]
MTYTILPLGDLAIQILYNAPITTRLTEEIQSISKSLFNANVKGIVEIVPALQTMTIYYDPIILSYHNLLETVNNYCTLEDNERLTKTKNLITIPTCYGGLFGEDLAKVASYHQITEEEVITIHTSEMYHVVMIGFLPGFPYLQGLSKKIYTPRLPEPRLRVPKGSVGIGGDQTGVYPLESPGGWNIIGQTPLELFQPKADEAFLFQPGDMIRFSSISQDEFYKIKEEISQHTYKIQKEVVTLEDN